ncbi:PEPxxWA-CTERM sorting domain-containing protein [Pseudaquabacterium rugosum]|uniref:PEPxxWA-CTERM sorting domain-containing protein n=1 Tax=Pseudaquabacterium rugosum TaxID=2984194 RepID=A0ABU9BFZ5_9BURK
MNPILKPLLAGLLAAGAVSAASADTLDLSISADHSGVDDFWTATLDFVLPAGFSNAALDFSLLTADDRAVVQLNGTEILSLALSTGSGTAMVMTAGGSASPYSFQYVSGDPIARITGPFVEGVNTLSFIVNDTWSGGYGDLSGRRHGEISATSLQAAATVSYTAPAVTSAVTSAVPEPATWALMLGGLAVCGAGLRRGRNRG